eukprot:gene5772-4123_t
MSLSLLTVYIYIYKGNKGYIYSMKDHAESAGGELKRAKYMLQMDTNDCTHLCFFDRMSIPREARLRMVIEESETSFYHTESPLFLILFPQFLRALKVDTTYEIQNVDKRVIVETS